MFWGAKKTGRPVILICDPDREVCAAVKSYLGGENYDVRTMDTAAEVISVLNRERVDAVVCETVLSDDDGFELCRRIRSRSNIPLIFLSRKNEEIDRVLGLKLGGDDYMGKPFSLRELSARLESVMRRATPIPVSDCVQIAELSLYPEAFSAFVSGKKTELIPSDFKLLYYLAVNLGKVISREKLLDAVWGLESTGSQRSVDTQIKRIRRAIMQPDVHFAIRTIYGVGYKLELDT